jgi:hypothetical protein
MQGHRLPATLEVIGSNPCPGKINLIKIEKTLTGFLTLKKSTSLRGKKNIWVSIKSIKHYQNFDIEFRALKALRIDYRLIH